MTSSMVTETDIGYRTSDADRSDRGVSFLDGTPHVEAVPMPGEDENILSGEVSSSRNDYILADEPESESPPDEPMRMESRSMLEEVEHELEIIMKRAEEQNPEYAAIVANATRVEDVSCDVWGASIWIVVHDLPDWRAGRMLFEGKVRTVYVLFVFACNFFIQTNLLFNIARLLMLPSLLDTQNLYLSFHEEAFSNDVVDPKRFDDMSDDEKYSLCGLALSQLMFVRVILFLWVTNNVGELRDTLIKMLGTLGLPDLPEGLDTRLMKRDLAASSVENNIICLNCKGKVGLVLIVFFPKFVISTVLCLTGCVWLMAAENIGDLILNSLALAFVVKVDELLASVFFPEHFLEEISDLAFVLPAPAGAEDKDEASNERAWEFMMCAITLLVTLGAVEVMILFQPVIPHYNYDVPGACMRFLDTQVPWCLPWQSDCFPFD